MIITSEINDVGTFANKRLVRTSIRRARTCLLASLLTLGSALPSGAADWKIFTWLSPPKATWTHLTGGGLHRYKAVNEVGDTMSMTCDPDARRDGWIIDMRVGGAPAPSEKVVIFRVGDDKIHMRSAEDGRIHLINAFDADPYYWLWTMIQQGKTLEIDLTDKRKARFTLAGARGVLSVGYCAPLQGVNGQRR